MSGAVFAPWAITSQAKQRSAQPDTHHGLSLAQALVSVDTGSGAPIFRVSCPQRLHFRGRFRTMVSGRIIRLPLVAYRADNPSILYD